MSGMWPGAPGVAEAAACGSLKPAPEASNAMRYASPAIAVVLTIVGGMLVFSALGKNPVEGFRIFFLNPVRDLNAITELLLKATPLMLIAVGLAVGFRANVWNIGAEGQFLMGAVAATGVALGFQSTESAARAARDDRRRRDRRRTVGGDPGAAQDEIQRQRDPDVADARLHRAARGVVARLRAVEGSGRLQFSADRDLHRLGIAADPDRRHSPQFRFPDRARRARWRLRLHAEELLGFQDARRR